MVPKKWKTVSRLREALVKMLAVWFDASAGEGGSDKIIRKKIVRDAQ